MNINSTLITKYLFASLLTAFTFQLSAQNNSFVLSNQSVVNLSHSQDKSTASGCDYLTDDGTAENSVGLVSGGDMMWLNSFSAVGGCEQIHTVSTAWGLMPDGATCRIILYDDPNNDGDPSDAVYLAETTTTVVNANTGILTDVAFPPTVVSGNFFVAGMVQNHLAGEFPAPLDQTTSEGYSFFVGNSVAGTFDEMNLMNNDLAPISTDAVGLPGNLMIRAIGEPAPPTIPVGNTAVFISFFLIAGLLAIRRIMV